MINTIRTQKDFFERHDSLVTKNTPHADAMEPGNAFYDAATAVGLNDYAIPRFVKFLHIWMMAENDVFSPAYIMEWAVRMKDGSAWSCASPSKKAYITEAGRQVMLSEVKANFVVDFYDMMDGWCELYLMGKAYQFEDREEAQMFADLKNQGLGENNKLAGERFAVFNFPVRRL